MHTHADHLSSGLTFQFVENVNHIPPLSLSPSLLADACSFAYRPLVVRIGPASGQICRRGVAIDSAIVIPTGASADARLKSAESRVRAIFPSPRGDRYSSGSGEPTMKTRKRPAARRYGATRPARENIREKEKEEGRERETEREESGLFSMQCRRRGGRVCSAVSGRARIADARAAKILSRALPFFFQQPSVRQRRRGPPSSLLPFSIRACNDDAQTMTRVT